LLAVGALCSVQLNAGNAFSELKSFHRKNPGWLFGHLGYGLMQETLEIKSRHDSKKWFDDGFFFQPEILIRILPHSLEIEAENPQKVLEGIMQTEKGEPVQSVKPCLIQNGVSKEEYINTIQGIQDNLQAGDCYELNYCQKYFADEVTIDPINTYLKLRDTSPNPFSALYKTGQSYCISASPERFLCKKGELVFSQPMKGTERRDADEKKDELNRLSLLESEKDKTENVMVVDLVRNDLSKFCTEGSVQVPELFGVHSYPYVHQMISTVSGRVDASVHWTDMLRHCFPMGSMTGAPKKRVAELIDQYEKNERGLFSGALGYVSDTGDFDFNVLIRSIFYHEGFSALHFLAGGGITIQSDPISEYEESCLKAQAMIKVLSS
jgi:para-aminobenzoate synthetase component 1